MRSRPKYRIKGRLSLGTLETSEQYATQNVAGKVIQAMVSVNWFNFEKTESVIDTGTVNIIQNRLNVLRSAGAKITFGLGVQDTPTWVFSVANSRYVDQNGNQSSQINTIFSQPVRSKVESYLSKLHSQFNLASMDVIRITSGGDVEALYPNSGNSLPWAYDSAAQGGSNRPSTVAACPSPGWKTGTSGQTTAQKQAWVDWYISSLVDALRWQMDYITNLGFKGIYEIVMPGSGIRPSRLASLISQDLPADPVFAVGAMWDMVVAKLPHTDRVRIHCSSVADGSGSLVDDIPVAADMSVAVNSSSADGWSAARWMARLANEYNMRKSGENPGYGDSGTTAHYADTTSNGLMAKSLAQARAGAYDVFYWAHDERLHDGTIAFSAYSAYAN